MKKTRNTRKTRKTRKIRHKKYGKTKKYGRGNSDNTSTINSKDELNEDDLTIIKKITDIFPETEFNVSKKQNQFTVKSKDNKRCATFTFYNDENIIFINLLSKCSITGTIVLEKMEELARIMEIKQIRLMDGSHIDFTHCSPNIRLNLELFSILCSGNSFYQKRGYFEKDYDKNYENNLEQIKKNIQVFFENCIAKLKIIDGVQFDKDNVEFFLEENRIATKNFILQQNENIYWNIINEVVKIYYPNIDEYGAETVEEFFSKIKESLLSPQFECKKIEKINNLLELIENTKLIKLSGMDPMVKNIE